MLLFDVPAEGGLVFEVERFAVGANQVTDGTGLLVSDDGLFLYFGCVDGCYRGLHFFVVEVGEHDFVVAVKAGHQRFLELVGKDMIAEGRFVVVDGLVLDLVVVDEVSGGGFEHETVFFGPVGTEAFVDARDDLGKVLFVGIGQRSDAGVDGLNFAFAIGKGDGTFEDLVVAEVSELYFRAQVDADAGVLVSDQGGQGPAVNVVAFEPNIGELHDLGQEPVHPNEAGEGIPGTCPGPPHLRVLKRSTAGCIAAWICS